jgi:hypothetical protein
MSDCAEAEVVRARDARGLMSNERGKVTIKAHARYVLWRQRIPTKGNQFFTLFADKSPPLEFLPLGPPEIGYHRRASLSSRQGPF